MTDFPIFSDLCGEPAQGTGNDLSVADEKACQTETTLPEHIDDILAWLEDMYPSMQVCYPTDYQRRAVRRALIRQAVALDRSLAMEEMQRVLDNMSFDL